MTAQRETIADLVEADATLLRDASYRDVAAWRVDHGVTSPQAGKRFAEAMRAIRPGYDETWRTVRRVARERGVSPVWLERFIAEHDVFDVFTANPYYKSAADMHLVLTEHLDEVLALFPDELEEARLRSLRARRTAERGAVPSSVSVRFPLRRNAPSRIVAYIGPTNSGKTHQAVERLAQVGEGIYAAPLRMLAMEVHDRLSERLGAERVGLVTGEERVNENAPVLCCTAEMAPMRARLLVLDEVQWAADLDRGWAWTRLLAGAEVDELYLTGEVGAVPLVRRALGDDAEVVWVERLVPLEIGEPISLDAIPRRSCVVAFSRKAVLHLSGLIHQQGRAVSVLYGSLPPEVRRAQVAKFVCGETDVVVATDVIGHGINLPIDAVVFSETDKFDGTSRRVLDTWEIAQIGGRAGRFGLSNKGVVTTLRGVPGFSASHKLLGSAFPGLQIVEGRRAHRRVMKAMLGPDLASLGVATPLGLRGALGAWEAEARRAAEGLNWVSVAPTDPIARRLRVLERATVVRSGRNRRALGLLDLQDAWRLARSPLDADDPVDAALLAAIGRVLAGDGRVRVPALHDRAGAEALERAIRELVGLRWATLAFPGRLGVEHDEVGRRLVQFAELLNAALDRAVENGVARCVSCGELCAPWFTQCDACHSARASWSRSDDDWDEPYFDAGCHERERDQVGRARENAGRRRALDEQISSLQRANSLYERPRGFPRTEWLAFVRQCETLPEDERAGAVERMVATWSAGHEPPRSAHGVEARAGDRSVSTAPGR